MTHRHFAVNGRTVNVPSYLIRAGDTISVREGHRDEPPIVAALQQARGRRTRRGWSSIPISSRARCSGCPTAMRSIPIFANS